MNADDATMNDQILSAVFGTALLVGAWLAWRKVPEAIQRTEDEVSRFLFGRTRELPRWYVQLPRIFFSGFMGFFGVLLLLSVVIDLVSLDHSR